MVFWQLIRTLTGGHLYTHLLLLIEPPRYVYVANTPVSKSETSLSPWTQRDPQRVGGCTGEHYLPPLPNRGGGGAARDGRPAAHQRAFVSVAADVRMQADRHTLRFVMASSFGNKLTHCELPSRALHAHMPPLPTFFFC